jgi:hypothetical protein
VKLPDLSSMSGLDCFRRVATVPRLFQIKLRVPPVPRIWGPVLNAIQNLSSFQIAIALVQATISTHKSPSIQKCNRGRLSTRANSPNRDSSLRPTWKCAQAILRKARIHHGAIGVSRYLSLENFGFPVIPLNLEVWYTLRQQLRLLRDSSNVLWPDRPCSVYGHRCNR